MKHLRDLKPHYNKAKRAYFTLLSAHLQDGICITQLQNRLGHHIDVTAEAYSAAKKDTARHGLPSLTGTKHTYGGRTI